MNQVFSFHRYWLLLKLDFAENGRRNALSFAVIAGLMVIMMSPVVNFRKLGFDPFVLQIMAYCVATFCTSLFTSLAFEKYASSTKGINAILIPASQTEKFLSILTSNLIFATLLITLYFTLYQLFTDTLRENIPLFIFLFAYLFFLVQSVCLLGSIYFKKATYIKTASVFFSSLLIYSFINRSIVRKLTNSDPYISAVPFGKWNVYTKGIMFSIEYSESTFLLIKIFLVFFVVALWYIAFVRLKEKEI